VSILSVVSVALKVLLVLLEERNDPAKAFARAAHSLSDDWRRRNHEFATKVVDEDAAAVADMLSDLHARRLRNVLTDREE
jgi:hypothetical protein